MDISVIVPVHNGEEVIMRQMKALSAQSFAGTYEVILVNNGSVDNSLGVMREFAASGDIFVVVDAVDAEGISDALNRGVALARADLVATTDQDDLVGHDWVGSMFRALATYELVSGSTLMQHEPIRDEMFDLSGFTEHLRKHGGFLPFAMNCNMGFRKSLHDSIGGFDSSMDQAQDIDFCWRAQLSGHTLGFSPEARLLKSLRDRPGSRFRQHVGYGRADLRLEGRFSSHGYSGVRNRALKQIVWLGYSWPRLVRTRRGRSDLLAVAGSAWGVLKGGLHARGRQERH